MYRGGRAAQELHEEGWICVRARVVGWWAGGPHKGSGGSNEVRLLPLVLVCCVVVVVFEDVMDGMWSWFGFRGSRCRARIGGRCNARIQNILL